MAIELEKTYLVKYLPENLEACTKKEIVDLYIPEASSHAKLRIRKNGSALEITKKEPVGDDVSFQYEHTIPLTQGEFDTLMALPGKKVRKIRHYCESDWHQAEIDIFQDELTWLVLADFEFETETKKRAFSMPDFCLAEVTHEEFIAGGMLSGRKYSDIESQLAEFDYKKL